MKITALLLFLSFTLAAHAATPRKGEPQAGRVIGVGGIFFKSDHQRELYAWYEKHLGFKSEPGAGVVFMWPPHAQTEFRYSTTWAVFPQSTTYFDHSKAKFMINYIVDDLDKMLVRLKAEGVEIDPHQESDAAGKFAWIYDLDGNKIELWQPAQGARSRH